MTKTNISHKQCTVCSRTLPITLFSPGDEYCTTCAAEKTSHPGRSVVQYPGVLGKNNQPSSQVTQHQRDQIRSLTEPEPEQIKTKTKEKEIKSQGSQGSGSSKIAQAARKELARRELSRRHLLPFVQYFNDSYLPGWVHKDICRRLEVFSQEVVEGKSPRLMLFLPPRSGKSEIASKTFPAWHLGHNPKHEIIATSYSQELALDFSRKVRGLIQDESYNLMFGVGLDKSSQSAERWNTSAAGGYVAAGVGGAIMGRGAHIAIIDDPVKNREEAESPTTRQKIKDWYTSTLYTRLAPGGGVLVIMTRWHDDDLAGWLLEQEKGGADKWEVIKYPAVAEMDEKFRKKGGALHSDRYPIEALQKIRAAIGERDWAALYQQNPVPDEGAYFRQAWFKYYTQQELPPLESLAIYQAWDFAIGQNETNDFSVGTTIGVAQNGVAYILDVTAGRWDSFEIVEEMLRIARIWKPRLVGGEAGQIEMSLGPILNKRMRETRTFFSVERLKTGKRDKIARARPLQARLQQGMVLLPTGSEWATSLKSEMLRFPAGTHDDQVDSLAWCFQMLDRFASVVEPKPKPKKSWRDKLKQHVKNGKHKRGHMTA